MKKLCLMIAVLICFAAAACAETTFGACVQIRASRDVRDSVVRTGEDVDITVTVNGFVPDHCQWYFNGMPIADRNSDVLHIDCASAENTGSYRMDAIDSAGKVRVSIETALRVVDVTELPKTGDSRLPMGIFPAAMLTSLLAAAFCAKRAMRAF